MAPGVPGECDMPCLDANYRPVTPGVGGFAHHRRLAHEKRSRLPRRVLAGNGFCGMAAGKKTHARIVAFGSASGTR